ncbi:hypothetical protein L0P88_13180 [Muricauda sp. SCSIO 64092]|uniref:hypothetical protein n=1 Tax=Allomuricauda sp. SCSIO 64092 TaxID=2908842 RepID=UPI001FF681F7|nr:hypothetical protein [Muricauda sp. SCSIO 64092]UOY04904.1 hypothetical protein L0P88_13180 [Muricauda sp. SCSIO 64092]
MKKLSLKRLDLNANDLLQREQLKTVFGGYGGGACEISCSSGLDCSTECPRPLYSRLNFY